MAELQEWSWGFAVKEWEFGEFEGAEGVRFIKDTEPFEVSPVLIGANTETRTIAVKGALPPRGYKWADVTTEDGGSLKILVPDTVGDEPMMLVTPSESAEANASGATKSGPDGDGGEEAGEGNDVGFDWKIDADLAMAASKYGD